MYTDFAESLKKTFSVCHKFGHETAHSVYKGCSSLPLVRNNIVRDFMKTDGDILFFLDDDLSWNAESILTLISLPHEFVGGVYRMKCENPVFPVKLRIEGERVVTVDEYGCIRVKSLPTGFIKIDRKSVV